MNTKLSVSFGLLLVIILSLMIVPKYMYAFFDTNIGKIILFSILVLMSSSNILLGMLFAIIIILISKEFRTNLSKIHTSTTSDTDQILKRRKFGPINVNQRIREQRPKSSKVFMNMYSKNSENTIPNDDINTYTKY